MFPALAQADLQDEYHSVLMISAAICHFIPASLLDTTVSDSTSFLRKGRCSWKSGHLLKYLL